MAELHVLYPRPKVAELQPDVLEIVVADEAERGAWRALSSRADAALH